MSNSLEGNLIQFNQSENDPEMVEVLILVSKDQFEWLEPNLLYQNVEIKLAEPEQGASTPEIFKRFGLSSQSG
jgi:hypothetical protein